MPPVPAIRGAALVRALERAGFKVTRVKGSHHRLRHPDGRSTTVPVKSGKDLPKGTLRSCLQDVAMNVDDLFKYL